MPKSKGEILDNGISASPTLVGCQTQGPFRLFTGSTSFSDRYPPSLCQLTFIPFHSNDLSVTHHSCSYSHPKWTFRVRRGSIELLDSWSVFLGPKPLRPSRPLWSRIGSGQPHTWNTTQTIDSCLMKMDVLSGHFRMPGPSARSMKYLNESQPAS